MPAQSMILPHPLKVQVGRGNRSLCDTSRVFLEGDLSDRLVARAMEFVEEQRLLGRPFALTRTGRKTNQPGDGDILLRCSQQDGESYVLDTHSAVVLVDGTGEAGVFYGLQTLRQLLNAAKGALPRLRIEDAPAFPHRGFYADITRGKVPKIEILKRLIRRLASLKYNQLQLYVEHVFDFRFDPAIGQGCSPLTAEDFIELDRYAHDYFIELVPSLTCFGHMGRLLSLPPYREFAECFWAAESWEKATWLQRMRGMTIDPRLPGSRKLLEQMLDEFLPLFRSNRFNLCGDETYDLGKGHNATYAERHGIAQLYLDHLKFLRKTAARYDKRLMFWGDVMLQHPEAIDQVPDDTIALDWGYDRRTKFEKINEFIRRGKAAYACPSTRGYQVVFNEVDEARANIAGYVRTAQRMGALGVLITDWGDMGHFNMQACSLHGLALGGAMAWNPASSEKGAFDKAFSQLFFGDETGAVAKLYKEAGRCLVNSWPFMLADLKPDTKGPCAEDKLAQAFEAIRHCQQQRLVCAEEGLADTEDVEELRLAIMAQELNAKKYELLQAMAGQLLPLRKKKFVAFSRDLHGFVRAYHKVWTKLNRPSGIKDIERALHRIERQARRIAVMS